jgi:hypothetical protein
MRSHTSITAGNSISKTTDPVLSHMVPMPAAPSGQRLQCKGLQDAQTAKTMQQTEALTYRNGAIKAKKKPYLLIHFFFINIFIQNIY